MTYRQYMILEHLFANEEGGGLAPGPGRFLDLVILYANAMINYLICQSGQFVHLLVGLISSVPIVSTSWQQQQQQSDMILILTVSVGFWPAGPHRPLLHRPTHATTHAYGW